MRNAQWDIVLIARVNVHTCYETVSFVPLILMVASIRFLWGVEQTPTVCTSLNPRFWIHIGETRLKLLPLVIAQNMKVTGDGWLILNTNSIRNSEFSSKYKVRKCFYHVFEKSEKKISYINDNIGSLSLINAYYLKTVVTWWVLMKRKATLSV